MADINAPTRGVCMVRASCLSKAESLAAQARAHSLKLVRSNTLEADLVINLPHPAGSQAFVVIERPAGKSGQESSIVDRLISIGQAFQNATVLLPSTMLLEPDLMATCTRLQLRVLLVPPGGDAVAMVLALALAAPQVQEANEQVNALLQEDVCGWPAACQVLTSLPLESGQGARCLTEHQAAKMSACGSVMQMLHTTAEDIADLTGCTRQQAEALTSFFHQPCST